jgi:plastocyanin
MKKAVYFLVFFTMALAGQLAAQTGFNGLAINNNLIFPQVAVGGGYSTDFFFQNPGNITDASGTLYFFDNQGLPMALQYQGAAVTQVSVNVPRGSLQKIPVSVSPDVLTVGWAIFVTQPGSPNPLPEVFGHEIFTYTSGGTVISQIGVLGTRYSSGSFRRISIPIQVANPLDTGVAVVNAGASPLNLTFELKDAGGNIVSRDTPLPGISPLAPGAHIAKFASELFPNVSLSNFLGTLDLVTDGDGMVALGLLLNGVVISTIPNINVPVVPQTVTVGASGFSFAPSTVTIRAGDTVNFNIDAMHNALEVTKDTWDVNGSTSNGGFNIPFGGGTHTFSKPGIYYYVCTAHILFGMKGTIIVN